MKILETNYLGLRLKNPLIVGSSNLTSSVDNILKLEDNGASAVILRSIFEEEIIAQFEKEFDKNIGIHNNNLEYLDYFDYKIKNDTLSKTAKLIQDAKQRTDIPIIASINCSSVGEWVSYAKILSEAGIDALELNLLKLSFDINQQSTEQEEAYLAIINKVKEYINVPLSIKMSPYSSNLAHEIHQIDKTGVNGITLFNRFYNVDFDINTDTVIPGAVYTSDSDYYNTLRWTALMSGKVKCDISASTGIQNAETAIKMLMAGAETVQLVSGIYKEGPLLIGEILSGIKKWMDKRGFLSIDEFRGAVHHDPDQNSEMFERVHFMRYFRDAQTVNKI